MAGPVAAPATSDPPAWDAFGASSGWLSFLRRYLVASALLHYAWEWVQLPLYTVWFDESFARLAFVVAHCTAGDVAIATVAMGLSLALLADKRWPAAGLGRVALGVVAIGVAYTVYSEWLNTVVREEWAYTDAMPTIPPLVTGLAPLLQWFVVPILAVLYARGRRLA
ncbi:MAG: hypothetical protein C6Y20_10940 [Tagaea sp. CACIAM 22H2]|jgi:hypothetical protein|nr:hypothetical protein [Tagaea sp. CACIAM 22H2]